MLLERRAAHLRKQTGNPNFSTKFNSGKPARSDILKGTILRLLKLLFGPPPYYDNVGFHGFNRL